MEPPASFELPRLTFRLPEGDQMPLQEFGERFSCPPESADSKQLLDNLSYPPGLKRRMQKYPHC